MMFVRTVKSAVTALVIGLLVATFVTLPRSARAEEHSIIKHPGDHPSYSVEIEPHLLAAFDFWAPAGEGFGLGGRFSIPLVHNGFISSINNNVAIGLGLDWAHYGGCYRHVYYYGYAYEGCPSFNALVFPIVMQWNFFLSTHFSVFGEPGIALNYASYGSGDCSYYDNRGVLHFAPCNGPGGSKFDIDPFVFFVGGRYHFSDKVSLTARLGWPYFSFGVSFFP
jgi:hypothetical protein